MKGRYDIQPIDIQHDDTQHNITRHYNIEM
jgi:hypothetical protein